MLFAKLRESSNYYAVTTMLLKLIKLLFFSFGKVLLAQLRESSNYYAVTTMLLKLIKLLFFSFGKVLLAQLRESRNYYAVKALREKQKHIKFSYNSFCTFFE